MAGHAKTVDFSLQDPLAAQTAVFGRLRNLLRGSEIAAQSGFDRCTRLEDVPTACRSQTARVSISFQQGFLRRGSGKQDLRTLSDRGIWSHEWDLGRT